MAQWRCIKESRLAGEASIVSAFHPPPPPHSPPPTKARTRERTVLYRREKIYTREREEEGETETEEELQAPSESRSNPETASKLRTDFDNLRFVRLYIDDSLADVSFYER